MFTRKDAAAYLSERLGDEIRLDNVKVRKADSGRVWIFHFDKWSDDAEATPCESGVWAEPWDTITKATFQNSAALQSVTNKLDSQWRENKIYCGSL